MRGELDLGGLRVGVTNAHLDWELAGARPRALADLLARLVDPRAADVEVLCGDFNEHDDGPVAAQLEAGSRDAVVESVGRAAAPLTLDFASNPRWAGIAVTERPGRFNRIYLRAAAGLPPPRVVATGIFGHPASCLGFVPSDHYGVFADLVL